MAELAFLAQANSAFVDEDYETALSFYSQAISANPSNPECYLKRASTYTKLGLHSQALSDAQMAAALSQGDQGIFVKAQLRRGATSATLKQWAQAREAFGEVLKVQPDDAAAKQGFDNATEEFVRAGGKLAPVDPVAPAADGTASSDSTTAPASIPTTASFLPPSKIRHEWFQNDNFVTISVFVKHAKPENVEIIFTERATSVTIKLPSTGSDYSLELDPLSHEIVPSESKYSVLSTKIEIKLKKANEGLKWGALEGEDSSLAQTMAKAPTYPTSSKKNWDAIAKNIEGDKGQGEEALNDLFRTIYKDASDETRRAMIKSYVESNGTCLSTNWDEVGKKRVEVTPPEGMVAKKYE
ncbi:SGS-domain-containing protein [Polychytrium aggregatum]|uniref:SGS-domain-containing protein n=1 Tax=Polychytrium aggregatum TaxID=110093 RepID=UPI0022FEB5FE|nr:SGS-domain-containing protein [Polychytrium aggregatum]KAI9205070.1 SGS-domain-containing protein [Polychytrium aggregatum]